MWGVGGGGAENMTSGRGGGPGKMTSCFKNGGRKRETSLCVREW